MMSRFWSNHLLLAMFLALAIGSPAEAQQSLPDIFRRAETLEKQGDYRGAVAAYSEALRIKPNQPIAHNSRGIARYRLNDVAGALADFSQAIALRPDYASPYASRGYLSYKQGQLDAALADLSKAIELYPKFPTAYRHRALVKIGKRDFSGAIGDLTKSLELEPGNDSAYHNRGYAKQQLEDWDGAIADYTTAVRIAPKRAISYRLRSQCRRMKNDPNGAIADCNIALQLKPDAPETFDSRGRAKRMKDDHAGAIADFTKAVELDPSNSTSYINRGLARLALGDFDGAIADESKAIELSPNDATAYHNRGYAKQRKGDLDGAIADFSKAIELRPTFELALKLRAETQRKQAQAQNSQQSGEQHTMSTPQQPTTDPDAPTPPSSGDRTALLSRGTQANQEPGTPEANTIDLRKQTMAQVEKQLAEITQRAREEEHKYDDFDFDDFIAKEEPKLKEKYGENTWVRVKKTYYRNGRPEIFGIEFGGVNVPHVDTPAHGLLRSWHENGQLERQNYYDCGTHVGVSLEWKDNGRLTVFREYVNGKLGGISASWEKCRLSYLRSYKDEKLDGRCIDSSSEENDDGRPWNQTYKHYRNGLVHGECADYYNDRLLREYTCEEGYLTGIIRMYDEQGELKAYGSQKRREYRREFSPEKCGIWKERRVTKDGQVEWVSRNEGPCE